MVGADNQEGGDAWLSNDSLEAVDPDEAKIVDNYRLDHLYSYAFRNGKGKFYTVVSSDPDGFPTEVELTTPKPEQNKVKTTLTFIRGVGAGRIEKIEFKRFKYYKAQGYVQQPERITFSFPFFAGLVGFLQGLSQLNLNDITERRIPLSGGPGLDDDTVRQFRTLAATEEGQKLIAEAVRNGQITSADLVNIGYRRTQLQIFASLLESADARSAYRTEKQIKKSGDEAIWQHFFEENTWIFGYGLNFIFNAPLDGVRLEQTVAGHDLAGAGKRSDGVLKTTGLVNSLCLVEIKTSDTPLLHAEPYRAECWHASKDLIGGIAQAQKTAQKTLENVRLSPELRPTTDGGEPTGEIIYSYKPKSYLLIGNLSEFTSEHGINREKFASFELLRRNTGSPEIITFDELFERAKFIVENS